MIGNQLKEETIQLEM